MTANDWFRAITNENLPFSGAPGQIGGGGSPPTAIQMGPYKSLAPDAPYAAPPAAGNDWTTDAGRSAEIARLKQTLANQPTAAAPSITDGLPRMGPPAPSPARVDASGAVVQQAGASPGDAWRSGNYTQAVGAALHQMFGPASYTPQDYEAERQMAASNMQQSANAHDSFARGLSGSLPRPAGQDVPIAALPQAPTGPAQTGPTSNGAMLANALPANAFATPLKFHALTGEHADSAHNNAFLAMLGASNGSFAPGSVLAPTAPAQIAAMQALDARNAPQAPQAQPFYVGKSNRDLAAMAPYAAPGMPRFLTPTERAQGSALNSALAMLNQKHADKLITDDQYINATRSLGQPVQGVTADMYGNALTGH
jgi:hypothetical protein